MKLAFEIAKTHLLSRPKQTIVAMMGVTFGIGMFIAMVSLMTGLNNFTEALTMASSPDIHIYHDVTQDRPSILDELQPAQLNVVHHQKPKKETSRIRNAIQIAEIIRKDKRCKGVAPMLATQVF